MIDKNNLMDLLNGYESVYFYKDTYTEENLRKMELNERQIKAVMYVKEKGKITNREYRTMFGITDRMALIDINALCKIGILEKKGVTGRNTEYILKEKPKINTKKQQKNECKTMYGEHIKIS